MKTLHAHLPFQTIPLALERGQETHILTNLLTLLTNFFLIFPHHGSSFFINALSSLRSLFPQYLTSEISSAKQIQAPITALTTQICISAQDLSPYVQRTASV